MRHRHHDWTGPHAAEAESRDRNHHHRERHLREHHRHDRHSARLFDYGELRLLVLAMIADQPRHGYELMKAIEDRMRGSYSPSPGVIYPTLAWLEDMGYANVEAEAAGRKRYHVTAEGGAFLVANRAAVDDLMSRIGPDGPGGRARAPAPVLRGMENLKLALRLRLKQGALDQTAAETIAAALDAAAHAVERS